MISLERIHFMESMHRGIEIAIETILHSGFNMDEAIDVLEKRWDDRALQAAKASFHHKKGKIRKSDIRELHHLEVAVVYCRAVNTHPSDPMTSSEVDRVLRGLHPTSDNEKLLSTHWKHVTRRNKKLRKANKSSDKRDPYIYCMG